MAEFLSLIDFCEIRTACGECFPVCERALEGTGILGSFPAGTPTGLSLPHTPATCSAWSPAVQPDSRALKEQGTLCALYILGLFLTSALSTLRSFLSPVRRKPYLAVLPVNTRPWDDLRTAAWRLRDSERGAGGGMRRTWPPFKSFSLQLLPGLHSSDVSYKLAGLSLGPQTQPLPPKTIEKCVAGFLL